VADGAGQDVVLERVFDAPVHLVWQLWTDPEHFRAWYGPEGGTIPVAEMDVRVGGRRRVCMDVQTPEGAARMWFAGEYREVVEHRRLVYTEAVSDERGGVPEEGVTEVRVELEDLGGRTRVVLTHVGVPGDSPGAAGWAMALEKLGARLSRTRS
jgi:uncharacterized protein YndB with AHSA1/START domain